jgi:dolichyl-phosphate beta-glucosyltransferase
MPDRPEVRLSVVIPAFNEEERLPATLLSVRSYLTAQPYPWEILVVNDGSRDRTAEFALREAPDSNVIRVIDHPDGANHGKGAAVRLGMIRASGAYRLFMDADNSTTIDQVERFWPWFDRGWDVVIGSRNLPGSEIPLRQPWYKELAGRAGNLWIRALAAPGISDTQAGFKMFSARSAGVIFPRTTIDRWGFDFEVLAIARLHRLQVRELPIRWVNSPASKVCFASYLEVLAEAWRVHANLRHGVYL